MDTNHLITKSRQGSAMVATILYTTFLLIILASLLSWTATEHKLTYRHAMWLEARNAAEALAEYGFSQITSTAKASKTILSTSSDDTVMFKTGQTKALQLPDLSLFSGSNFVSSGANAPVLLGGTVKEKFTDSTTKLFLYTPGLNNNDNDIDVNNKSVKRRDIMVLAKATVSSPTGAPVTSYVQEIISVRAVPLFTAAIFYNLDMELHPGPTMNIGGPVVVNGNLYVNTQGSSSYVNFQDTVSASGNIYHAWKSYKGWVTGATGSTSEDFRTGNVFFNNGASTTSNGMYASSKWNDSTMDASSTLNSTVGTLTTLRSYTDQADYNKTLSDAADSKYSAYVTWAGQATGGAGKVLSRAQPASLSGIGDYKEETNTSTDDSVNSGHLIIEPAIASGSLNYDAAAEEQKFATQAGVVFKVNAATGAITMKVGGATVSDSTSIATYESYTKVSGSVTKGIWDQRRTKGINLVKIDYAKLRTAVAASTFAGSWTGIVYVEVSDLPYTVTKAGADANTGAIAGYKEGATYYPDRSSGSAGEKAWVTSVAIINGANTSSAGTPSVGTTTPGLTIATNAPVYVVGHYNADGTTDTSSITTADSAVEKPACVAGDAVTLLSKDYNFSTSASTVGTSATAAEQEVSAAIITGITPTNKGGNNQGSGGAHNLLRFLEDWSGKGNYVRGSLVCMYESRVAVEEFNLGYYKPPNRNWGLHNSFKNGIYPPGTPMSISFRRVGFKELSATDYNIAKGNL